MGTWGTAIFSDDMALDIKGEFRDKIGSGMSPEDATKELVKVYKEELDDSEEANVFWLALAATQWPLGRLQEDVKQKALEIIESGQDLQRWSENEKDYNKRKAYLEKLKLQLLSQQPPQKKIRKPFIRSTKMETGDLIAYKHKNGNIALLRVLDIGQDQCGDTYPKVEILDHFSEILPEEDKISKLNRKMAKQDPNDTFTEMIKPSGTYYLSSYGKRDKEPWNSMNILYKNTKSIDNSNGPVSMCWWKDFDEFLEELFEWKEKDGLTLSPSKHKENFIDSEK